MQTLQHSYNGLNLLLRLNWDRMLPVLLILGSLMAGAWIGGL